MRRQIAAFLRSAGLMPFVFKTRMVLAPVMPGTLANNLSYWFSGDRETLPLPPGRARFLVAGSADIHGFSNSASGRRLDPDGAPRRRGNPSSDGCDPRLRLRQRSGAASLARHRQLRGRARHRDERLSRRGVSQRAFPSPRSATTARRRRSTTPTPASISSTRSRSSPICTRISSAIGATSSAAS